MDIIECIRNRRSIRQFNNQRIESEKIERLLEAAISAPSGKNIQPWKFSVVNSPEKIGQLTKLSLYSRWIRTAKCFIIVYLDKSCSYDYVKDMQSCGAAVQNILLAAHSMGIGSCWVGEFVKDGEKIKKMLDINNDYLEVMSIVALGYSDVDVTCLNRKELDYFIVQGSIKSKEYK